MKFQNINFNISIGDLIIVIAKKIIYKALYLNANQSYLLYY